MFRGWNDLYDKQRAIILAITVLVVTEESNRVEMAKVLALSGLDKRPFDNILEILLREKLVAIDFGGGGPFLSLGGAMVSLLCGAPPTSLSSEPEQCQGDCGEVFCSAVTRTPVAEELSDDARRRRSVRQFGDLIGRPLE